MDKRQNRLVLMILVVSAFLGGYLIRRPIESEPAPGHVEAVPSPHARSAETLALDPASESIGDTKSIILPSWARSDLPIDADTMSAAVREMKHCGDPVRQEVLFSMLLLKLEPGNAWAAWDVLKQGATDGPEALRRLSLFGRAWGKVDGETALRAASRSSGREGKVLAARVVEGWAAANPDSAYAYMEKNGGFATREFRLGFLEGLAQSDPELAARYLGWLQSQTDPLPYIEPVLEAQLAFGIPRAEAWAADLPGQKLQANAFTLLARYQSKKNLDEAVAWVTSIAEAPHASEALATVAEARFEEAKTDAELADCLKWMAELPEGSNKNLALERALRTWARRDPNAAAGYLISLPENATKDPIIRVFSLEAMKKDPEAAVHWAATIKDPRTREKTLLSTARQWYRRDPEATEQWMQASQLPPEIADTIRGSGE